MSEPITWRSLINVDLGQAERPLVAANNMITGGLDRLAKTLTDREAVEQKALDRQQEAEALSIREALYAAKTPEELAKLTPQLVARASALDPKFRAPLVGAAEERQGALQKSILENRAFQDNQIEYQNREPVQKALALAAQGKSEEAAAILAPLEGKLPKFAEHMAAVVKGGRDAETYLLNQQKTWMEMYNQTRQADTAAENAKANLISARAQASQAETARTRVMLERLQAAETASATTAGKMAEMASGTIGNPEGQKALVDEVTKLVGDKTRAEKLVAAASKAITQDPNFASLPTSVVLQTVLKHSEGVSSGMWANLFSDGGTKSVAEAIKRDLVVAADQNKDRIAAQANRQAGLTQIYEDQRAVADQLRGQLFPNLVVPKAATSSPAATAAAPPSAAAAQPAMRDGPLTAVAAAAPRDPMEGITVKPGKTETSRGGSRSTTKYMFDGKEYDSLMGAKWARQVKEEEESRRAFARSLTQR